MSTITRLLHDGLAQVSRRRLFEFSGLAALLGAARPEVRAAESAGALQIGPNLFESIGVQPVINAKGTFTIISGSQSLPEVKQAMMEASKHYVHMDELMDAVGRRLAALTGAEWGMVTNGCAAALTHATSACIAGGDPEKMQRLPILTGLKSEVIVPAHSRNVYDHAIRMLGVKMVTVSDMDQLQKAINSKTAMFMVLASPDADREPMSTEAIARIARAHNIPLIVDAAAEVLTIPNKHLKAGANLVAYSGGKCLRGPQAAGLLLGQKDLIKTAWVNSAPHHAFGRSLKVGKEETMGMLAAVEAWVKRDYKAEFKVWEGWLDSISSQVKQVPGVTTAVHQPDSLSNHAPTLQVKWDPAKLGVGGREIEKAMLDGRPRIILAGSTRDSVTIMPYMMMPGDYKIVGDKLQAMLAKPPAPEPKPAANGPDANLDGQWNLVIDYDRGSANHTLVFEQKNDKVVGTHRGDITQGELAGQVKGSNVNFRSRHRYEGTSLGYDFTGKMEGDTMSGTVGLGEYGSAKWKAERHHYRA